METFSYGGEAALFLPARSGRSMYGDGFTFGPPLASAGFVELHTVLKRNVSAVHGSASPSGCFARTFLCGRSLYSHLCLSRVLSPDLGVSCNQLALDDISRKESVVL